VLYNPRTKPRKGLVSYYKTNGISTLKKHVDSKHSLLVKKLDEQVNSSMKTQVERQPTKKKQNVSHLKFLIFFLQNFLIRRMKCNKNNFLKI
jgi:hypothetical protein